MRSGMRPSRKRIGRGDPVARVRLTDDLPHELHLAILSFATRRVKDLLRLSLVCPMWKRLLLGPDCLASRPSVGLHRRLFGMYKTKLRLLSILTASIWGLRGRVADRRAKWERKRPKKGHHLYTKGNHRVPDWYLHKRRCGGFDRKSFTSLVVPSSHGRCWLPMKGVLLPEDADPAGCIGFCDPVEVLRRLLKEDGEPEPHDRVRSEAPVVVAAVASVNSLEGYLRVLGIAQELSTVTKQVFKLDRVRTDRSDDAVRNFERFSLEFWPYFVAAVMVLWTGFAGTSLLLMPSFLAVGVLELIFREVLPQACRFARRMFVETRIRRLGQIADEAEPFSVERNTTDLRLLLCRKSALDNLQSIPLIVTMFVLYGVLSFGIPLCLTSRECERNVVFIGHLALEFFSMVASVAQIRRAVQVRYCLIGFFLYGVFCAFHVVVGMNLDSRWALIALFLCCAVHGAVHAIWQQYSLRARLFELAVTVSPSAYLVVCCSYGFSSLWILVPLGLVFLFVSNDFSYRAFKASGFVTLSPQPWLRLIKSDIPRVCCFMWNMLLGYADLLRAIRNSGRGPCTGRRKRSG